MLEFANIIDKMKLKRLITIIMFVLYINITYAQNLSFDGDKVFINDSNVYMSQTPHTIYSTKGVFENVLISKKYSGNVDIAFGFNSDNMLPKKALLYNPHVKIREESFTCDKPYFYNYTTNPLKIYCWYNHTDINFTELITSRDDITHYDLTGKTFFWNIEDKYDYKNINNIFTREKFNYNNKNIWYYATGLNINKDTEYKIKIEAEIKSNTQGKYDFCIKPSSQSFSVAKLLGNIYCLDPYFNTTCVYSEGSDWTITDGTSCVINNNITMGTDSLFILNGSVLINNSAVVRTNLLSVDNNNGLISINNNGLLINDSTPTTEFNPLQIDNITLWLDATNYSALVTSLGGIGTWKDQSGNGYDFSQGTYAYQPKNNSHTINGLPVLYFNDDWIFRTDVMGLTGNPAITIIYVRKYYDLSSTDNNDFYIGTFLTTDSRAAIFTSRLASDGTNSFRYNGGNKKFNVADGNSSISMYVRNASTTIADGSFYENGVFQSTSGTGNPTLSPSVSNVRSLIGTRVIQATGSIATSGMSDTDIGEILVYNRNLTKSELNQIGTYLSNKWGINWTTIT